MIHEPTAISEGFHAKPSLFYNRLMKIAVLDAYALNPGDLSWDWLKEAGNAEIFDSSTQEEAIERSKGKDAIIINKIIIGKNELDNLPNLKYIGVSATGYNVVDIEECRKRGIAVTNIPAYSTDSVAELVFALLLEYSRRTAHHENRVRHGAWEHTPIFTFWDYPQMELAGKTFGIIGMGSIGRKVAKIADAFDMKVIYSSRTEKEDLKSRGYEYVTRDELFRRADIISLHTPMTQDTDRMINRGSIALMKENAILINTSRGGLIDEDALYEALKEKRIAAALADVLTVEPPRGGNRLLSLDNFFATPHIAWATKEARSRLMDILRDNLHSFMKGESRNRIC